MKKMTACLILALIASVIHVPGCAAGGVLFGVGLGAVCAPVLKKTSLV